MRRFAGIGVAAFAVAILLSSTACSGGNKAGGASAHQIKLVMQTPDAPEPDAEYFIAQVKARSRGQIQILEGADYSGSNPDNEARLVHALRSGKVQIAYLPSRAWERASSVTSFRALQAPFLVTSYPLLRRITTDSIGSGMLASLGRIGVVGLGLVPDELRRAFGRRPLVGPQDFRGARIRVITSPTSVLAVRSLASVPLTNYTSHQVGDALRKHELDGAELSTVAILNNSYVPRDARYLTANLALFAKTQTIAIRKSVYDRLSSADRTVLREAASATVAHADPAKQEKTEVIQLCHEGLRLGRSTNADLASLGREGSAGYPSLTRDPATRRELRAIERLKAQVGTGVSALAPCANTQSTVSSTTSPAGLLGSYTTTLTGKEHFHGPGASRLLPGTPSTGKWELTLSRASATFTHPQGNFHVTVKVDYGAGQIRFAASTDCDVNLLPETAGVYTWSVYRGTLSFREIHDTCVDRAGTLTEEPWHRR